MTISRRKTGMWAVVAGAALSLAVMAGPAAAQVTDFNFDPDATGGAGGDTFNADRLNLQLTSIIDQTVTGPLDGIGDTFEEIGAGFFDSATLGFDPTDVSEFGNGYDAYVIFEAAGTVAPIAGGIRATITTLTFEAYLDPDEDTTLTPTPDLPDGTTDALGTDDDGAVGLPGGTAISAGSGPNGAAWTFGNTADDFLIAQGNGVVGPNQINITGGFTQGDFRIVFQVDTAIGAAGTGDNVLTFPSLPAGTELVVGDLFGDVSNLAGVTGGTFVDGVFVGSTLTFQQVPEPATLAMFGTGLLGLGALARMRRRRQAA